MIQRWCLPRSRRRARSSSLGDPCIRFKPQRRNGRLVLPLTQQPSGVHVCKVIIPPERGERELRTAPQVPERARGLLGGRRRLRRHLAHSRAGLCASEEARGQRRQRRGGRSRRDTHWLDPESHEAVSEIHAHALEHEPSGRIRSQVGEEDRPARTRPRTRGMNRPIACAATRAGATTSSMTKGAAPFLRAPIVAPSAPPTSTPGRPSPPAATSNTRSRCPW